MTQLFTAIVHNVDTGRIENWPDLTLDQIKARRDSYSARGVIYLVDCVTPLRYTEEQLTAAVAKSGRLD
jgi:hypothetical protein